MAPWTPFGNCPFRGVVHSMIGLAPDGCPMTWWVATHFHSDGTRFKYLNRMFPDVDGPLRVSQSYASAPITGRRDGPIVCIVYGGTVRAT